MLKPSDINLIIEQVTNDSELIVTNVEPKREYSNGKYGAVIGTKYKLVIPKRGYEQLTISTDELLPVISQEQIDASDNPIYVEPVNFTAKFYKNYVKNEYFLTAKADTMNII